MATKFLFFVIDYIVKAREMPKMKMELFFKNIIKTRVKKKLHWERGCCNNKLVDEKVIL